MDEPIDEDGAEILSAHSAQVGSMRVRRALPQRRRRTVGAWCFADHMGPADVTEGSGLDVGPHPHTGLQTVTWLIDGEALHRDSLGSEQVIAAGELNLMTAGYGVSHAEEATGHYRGTLQGIQLWIAQSDERRDDAARFEHQGDLPQVELAEGSATVLLGEFNNARSPVRSERELMGADLRVKGTVQMSLEPTYEYGAIVLEGLIELEGRELGPGTMAYLRPGRDELEIQARPASTIILLGGVPLDHEIFMWWNFVARTRAEIDAAYDSWRNNDGRFGKVDSPLARIETLAPYWRTRES
jgi:redox-sensitive bicupin YhaK (pirin superfamily)